MAADHRYSVSVAGVIVDEEGRALIIQRRDNGHWEPPGGVLEHGETIEDGLRREVFEETGIKVTPGPVTGIYQNMERHIVALVFRCAAEDRAPVKNSEVAEFLWASPQQVTSLMDEAYAVRVLDAAATSMPPQVRSHDGVRLT